MSLTSNGNSGHLRVEHHTNLEELRGRAVLGDQRWLPFEDKPLSLHRAVTALSGSLLLFQQSSARHIEGTFDAGGCTIILPMDYTALPIANGHRWEVSEISLSRGTVPIDLVDEIGGPAALVRFPSPMQDRGWDETEGAFTLSRASEDHLRELRKLVVSTFAVASDPGRAEEYSKLAASFQDDLVAALDQALIDPRVTRATRGSFDKHRRMMSRLDEIMLCEPDKPLYSDALAQAVGVSVRTLQTAARIVHGMTLHQYIRLKRLWLVRAQLVKGSSLLTVKAAAYANGFSHMGELSASYKDVFRETPSETLLRAREQR